MFFCNKKAVAAYGLLGYLNENPFQYDSWTLNSLITHLAKAKSPALQVELAETLHRLVHRELSNRDKPPCWQHGSFDHVFDEYIACRKVVPDEYLSSFLVIASQENNGYIREDAVRAWKTQADPMAIPFLIQRLHDWVPVVQNLAFETLQTYMTPRNHTAFLEQLPLTASLFRCGRRDAFRYACRVTEFVYSVAFSEGIKDTLKNFSEKHWRCYVDLASVYSPATALAMLKTVRDDKCMSIRSLPVRMIDSLPAETQNAVVCESLNDMAQPIRKRAVFFLVKHLDRPGYDEMLRDAVLDYSPSIRETARYYLREKIGDWRTFYLDRLDLDQFVGESKIKRRRMLGVFRGFTEYALPDDLALLEDSARRFKLKKVRLAALQALYRLDRKRCLDLARELLKDPVAGASRYCLQIGMKDLGREALDFARNLAGDDFPATRTTGLRFLARFNGWETGADFVRALADPDDSVRKEAASHLEKWLVERKKVSWNRPSPEVAERIRKAVEYVMQSPYAYSAMNLLNTTLFLSD